MSRTSSAGLRPSDSPTRSLARRFAGALRSRGSLAVARSLASIRWRAAIACAAVALIAVRAWPHAPLRERLPMSTAVWSADGELLRVTLSADDQYRLWVPLSGMSPSIVEDFLCQSLTYN